MESAPDQRSEKTEKGRMRLVLPQALQNKMAGFVIPAVDQVLNLAQTFFGKTDTYGCFGFADG
jgi:hypothetical protein